MVAWILKIGKNKKYTEGKQMQNHERISSENEFNLLQRILCLVIDSFTLFRVIFASKNLANSIYRE